MKPCSENSESTVASSNPQTIGGVAWRVRDAADGWIIYDNEKQAAWDADQRGALIEALVPASTIEHQLSVNRELREALSASRPYVNGERRRLRSVRDHGTEILVLRIDKALSHPIIGDKS